MTATLTTGFLLAAGAFASEPRVEFFEAKVRPLFVEHCQKCHGPAKQSGGLRLDSGKALRAGGDNGPIVVRGDPAKSKLLVAIRQSAELKMPPTGRLSDEQIESLDAWVKAGAVWPEATNAAAPTQPSSHWAFQPVHVPDIPKVGGSIPANANPLDAFILAKLDERGMTLSPPADRATWLRRVTLDLHGLPPTPKDLDELLADPASDAEAYAKVVDRLLSSPRYGERWGRHWLDVARYADSKGYVFTEERRYPYAYTYRDYVVRAFNEDQRYDQFIIEQLAADRLPSGDPRSLAALGFLTLGRRFLNNTHDIIDDRIDVVTRGLLGLTVTCARCHDHKYDPIPTSDYYSLYGVFASCEEPKEGPLLVKPEQTVAYAEYLKQLGDLEASVAAFRQAKRDELSNFMRAASQLGGVSLAGLGPSPLQSMPADRFDKLINWADREKLRGLKNKVEVLRATSPAAPPRGMVVNDLPKPVEPHILVRGNPANRGAAVPRQFLSILAPDRQPFHDGSGRLELARAIADPKNPLTARVLVNRVWAHHFGRGLVNTPSDFGLRSDAPSHPELLDWLADRFIADGWSIKNLHRRIVLSKTYCQSSAGSTPADPENRLLSHFSRQRLDLEALRDSLLFVAGRLDFAIGGPAVDIVKEPFSNRRTVYGFIDRQNLPGLYRTFDFASPDTHTPQRYSTTVPQQALFLMNSPFSIQQAQSVMARPEITGISAPEQRVVGLYRMLFGRIPNAEEIDLGIRFVAGVGDAPPSQQPKLNSWERYVQVLLLSNEFAFVD
jgi:hypothetical protein